MAAGPATAASTPRLSRGAVPHHRGLRTRTTSLPGTHLLISHGPADTRTWLAKWSKPVFHPTTSATWAGRRSSKSDSQSASGVWNVTVTVRPLLLDTTDAMSR